MYRLTILNETVDKFVLVEATHTFAGNVKKLYYKENKHLFKRFEHKIIHIVVDSPYVYPNINYSNNEQWENEYYQRNCIHKGIEQLELCSNDLIIISDIDEIIDPNTAMQLKDMEIQDGYTLLQDMYYYNLNTKHTEKWLMTKIVTYEKYRTTTPQEIRVSKLPHLENGGWHLSYFGNKEFIKNKLKEFSHQEYNNETYTDDEAIEHKINNNIDLFNRNYVPIEHINIDQNANLPPLYDKYLLNYVEKKVTQSIPIYIYFHICCINNWKEIVSKLLFKVKSSGLYNILKEIRCVVLGDYDNSLNDPKMKIIHYQNIQLAEKATINLLLNDSKDEEFNVLYIHSKGVKHFNGEFEKNVNDWVDLMCYFNIYNFNTCLNELNTCNGVGVNVGIALDEGIPLHFSGNFWWSKSSHIRNLKVINDNYWNSPEFWISSANGVYKSLWGSGTNHYSKSYPYYLYENKNVNIIIYHV